MAAKTHTHNNGKSIGHGVLYAVHVISNMSI
jgi:hypothetical protein